MSKKRLTRKSTYEKREAWFEVHEFWRAAVSGLLSVVLSLLGLSASLISYSGSKPSLDIFSPSAFTYFVVGIILLAIIVVVIASFIRHKNRGAILLKQRLSEIYLSALRRSAFNPQLGSPTLDE